MKWLKYYDAQGLRNDEEVFAHLVNTLRPGVTDWEYFVNWDKVFANTKELEVALNTLNYLLGKDDFENEFRYLLRQDPRVVRAIPALIVRNGSASSEYSVITVNNTVLTEEHFDFSKSDLSDDDIEQALLFVQKSGLIRIFSKEGVKNLVDYVIGVEAGLSSNGRKNRGGKAMEKLCESLLQNMGCDYISQASPEAIRKRYGVRLVNSQGRLFDFVVRTPNELIVLEVNCYSSGGSKLDKTASDYRQLQQDLQDQAKFVWLTDGWGWRKTKNPLRKTFDVNDYILNIKMVESGALGEILGV